MSFSLPTFNLECSIWLNPVGHAENPPDATSVCQLRAPGRRSSGQDSEHTWYFLWELLVPALTDLRDWSQEQQSQVEVPSGSGRFYNVVVVDDVAKGFPNEYRIAFIHKRPDWPIPIP